jgi:hypothetical protein
MSDSVHRFRMAMAKHLGRMVTPEVAAAIEAEAFYEPDRAVDPEHFTPTVHGEYVIQVERFRDIQEELHPLHVLHYAETERHRRGIALAPKYDRVRAMERAGGVVQFTARRHGELAAQLRLYLSESVHTASVVASEDALFLAPAHRPNAFLMIALLRYAEQVLIDLGAHEIHANSKKVNNAAVLMRRLGYDEVATQFIKIVKRKERSDVQ